ncbi:prefoldin subunit 2-like [Asterias rubens]|uniref:prefoldin subunit 2-like n=1 Tax=Asterias rubens TaxID=7604 RepID=UPI00145504B0|nr:prefoldin subunit 2-like [Asterias rubens]
MADKKGKQDPNVFNKSKGPTNEQIVGKFNQLRQEQRSLMSKIAELEGDQNEHRLVIEALKDVNGERKCFRLVGGVLVERTVKDVTPALQHNKDQLGKLVEALTKQVEAKGKEINDFREKHNIRVKGEQAPDQADVSNDKANTQGVLVAGT